VGREAQWASSRFLKALMVGACTTLSGRLFQVLITLSLKMQIVIIDFYPGYEEISSGSPAISL
jgi:hypothetical protein